MSTTTLDPTVVSKLRHFSRRRFRMILMRGLCAALVTFLLCMAVVAFLDWGWVLSDNARWLLSGVAYLLTAVVAWVVCGRKIVHAPAQEEIAVQVEGTEPELREHLLSAVELATDNPEAVHDSPVFRGLLQGRVAKQMALIRIGNLLPVKLMVRWLVAAVVVAGVIAYLLTSGGPRFRSLAARAVMPMANIDRVSRIKVEILQPTPNSLMIAKDETVAIVVATSGGDVDEAILETYVAGKPPVQQSMRARTDSEFAANIHVDADVITYRILAGDAVTKRHTINGKNRPRVTAFHKTFQYPDYSGIEDATVTEDHGDVIVLEGSKANIALELDQEVSEAELRIDVVNSDDVTAIPLTLNSEGRWFAAVPVDKNAIYKVHLVSKETGFENLFSPRYEIRPLPDLIPRTGFVDQQDTNLLLPPNDILALKGMAEDDLPLQTLEQEISVNGRDWVTVLLEVDHSTQASGDDDSSSNDVVSVPDSIDRDDSSANRITAAWDWDLLDLKLKTGDQITTRLVATDLKGNRGESVPIRIVVSAPDFDPERHATMERKAALIQSIDRCAQVAEEHRKAALEIVTRMREDVKKSADEQRPEELVALDCTSLTELAGKVRESATTTLKEVNSVLQTMPAGVDAYELQLAGGVLARIVQEHTHRPAYAVAAFQRATELKQRQSLVDKLKEGFERSSDDAKSLAYQYRNLVSHDIFSALAWDFHAMRQQQKLVAESPTQTFSRLKRQETVVVNQLQVVERLAKQQRRNVPDFLRRHLDQLVDWTDRWIGKLDQSMESEDKLADLQQNVKNLYREMGDRQRYDVIDGGMVNRLLQARRDLDHRSGSMTEPLSQVSTATHEETRRLVGARDADDSTKAAALMQEAAEYAGQVDLLLRPALEQLRVRRILSQARVDSDAQFAADAGLTHRATTALLSQHRQGDPKASIVPTAFREIAPAYRILEAGHDVANVQKLLDTLIQVERWRSQDFVAITQHPRQWDAINKGMEEAVQKMRHAGIHKDLIGKFDQVRWSAATRAAGRKISERRWKRDKPVAAGRDLLDLKDDLEEASVELLPVMAEARAVIAKYAPTISEMAEQIAQNVRELEDETTETADAVEEAAQADQPEAAAELDRQLAQLDEQQEQINQQIDDLFEALVEDANQQDLMNAEERERARDSDDSIAMVQEPAEQMNQAMQEAQDAADSETQAQELAKAADQQEKTAQALQKVAQHFDKLEKGEDVADTRAELRLQERDMGIARQLDQQFEEVEQLAQMTTSTSESLMQQLEQELENNPAMREALSEIAQNTVEESRNALEDAANQEQEIQKANERADKKFQQQKRELAEDLRELGKEASNLSSRMVAQADSAASQAKTPEAKQKFQETRQQLQEAANAANNSNENQLLEELAQNVQKAQTALQQASESLADAKQKSADAKSEEIHSDDKNRQNAKKNLESQRKRFADQLKRESDQKVRQRDQEEKREDVNVRNAERNLKNVDRQVQQTKQRAGKKPDDQNLKNQVAQAEERKQQAQQKVDAAKQKRQQAQQRENEAREERNKLNAFPQQPLNDKNPAAQLAEALANEATKTASELTKKAEDLAKRTDFGNELTPSKQQLASSEDAQRGVTEDVAETSEDLSRAARHERRLGKNIASEALQQAAEDVGQVAENESTQAEQQLAAAEAAASDPQLGQQQPQASSNEPVLAANEAVATAEEAITGQADALTPVVEAAAQAAAAQEQSRSSDGQPQDGQPQGSAPVEAQATTQQSPSGPPNASGQAPAELGPPSPSQPQSFTPKETTEGRQLAQALDELDQAQAAAQAQSQQGQAAPPGEPSAEQPPQSLAQAAQARAAQLAQQRAQAQQQSQLAQDSESFDPDAMPQLDGQTGEFLVKDVNRSEEEDWGKLRKKEAEDLTKGRREAVSEEYRKSVEAYFKVLAERSRRPGHPGR